MEIVFSCFQFLFHLHKVIFLLLGGFTSLAVNSKMYALYLKEALYTYSPATAIFLPLPTISLEPLICWGQCLQVISGCLCSWKHLSSFSSCLGQTTGGGISRAVSLCFHPPSFFFSDLSLGSSKFEKLFFFTGREMKHTFYRLFTPYHKDIKYNWVVTLHPTYVLVMVRRRKVSENLLNFNQKHW